MKRFKIEYSFYLICICFLFSPYQDILFKLIFVLLLHELGHLFFIFLFHIKINQLRLHAFGFFMDIENQSIPFYKDFFVYIGGILFNFISFFILPKEYYPYIWFMIFINSLPIYPLDGFMVLKTGISYLFPYKISLYLCHSIGLIFLGWISILFVKKMDALLFINLLYLFFLGVREFFGIQREYEAFILNRYLEPPKLKKRRIHFHYQNASYLYRYQKIYIRIGNKTIDETDILRLKYERI